MALSSCHALVLSFYRAVASRDWSVQELGGGQLGVGSSADGLQELAWSGLDWDAAGAPPPT